jgi:hypothetical protein
MSAEITAERLKAGIERAIRKGRNARYWRKNSEKIKERCRNRYKEMRSDPTYMESKRKSSRKYLENNREKVKEAHASLRRKARLDVLSHYSNGTPICACCGEDRIEFLAIDIINGDNGVHRRVGTGHPFYCYLIKNNYPPGYRVLCHNCNSARGLYGYCPHEVERKALRGTKLAKIEF